MACPECGCKETYCYDEDDDMPGGDERLERCAACGEVFDIDDAAPEDDDEPVSFGPCRKCGCESEGAPGHCYACMTPNDGVKRTPAAAPRR